MADKFANELLAQQTLEADRLIEMFDKIPDLLPKFTNEQTEAYHALMAKHDEWRKTLRKGQQELLALTDESEYTLRKLALLERDAELTRETANALAAIIRNEL